MAVKLKKYPRKPKQSASVEVKENFLRRCAEIDKENRAKIAKKKKSEALTKKIAAKKRPSYS